MKSRYTFGDLAADINSANRALLDAPKPGCYFYTLGQSYERTQLYASRIEPDGSVCQFDQIESGTPRECLAAMYRSELAGHCHPYGKINRHQAAGMLLVCSDIMQHDSSYTLRTDDMDTVTNMVRACRYRKPVNAPGSTGRMFFESVKRVTS